MLCTPSWWGARPHTQRHTLETVEVAVVFNVYTPNFQRKMAARAPKGSAPPKSQSELLEEETIKMEAKLRVLKAEMAKQRAEAEVCVALPTPKSRAVAFG
jgi:hypothetical protein